MEAPNCYKCKTETNLSLKRTLKSGHMLFICRPCRRVQSSEYTKRKSLDVTDVFEKSFNQKAWREWAKECNSRLSAKYRDEKFLEAKGLL